jgi:hypothetical protein
MMGMVNAYKLRLSAPVQVAGDDTVKGVYDPFKTAHLTRLN